MRHVLAPALVLAACATTPPPPREELVIVHQQQGVELPPPRHDLFGGEYTDQASRPKQFTGKTVDIVTEHIDLRPFLELMSKASGKNIVAADDVDARVALRLRNVPWDEALDLVLGLNGLELHEVGTSLVVERPKAN